MPTLRLIALEDTVVFPGMTVTLPVDVGDESQVLLVPRHGTEYANVGTVADVVERVRLPGRGFASVVMGLHRGIAGAARTDPQGRLRVEAKEVSDETPPPSPRFSSCAGPTSAYRSSSGPSRSPARSPTPPAMPRT